MGRIEKAAGPKQEVTIPEGVSTLVQEITHIPAYDFPTFLRDAQRGWPFPRGDLYHWIPVLNKFDDILERFAVEYGLDKGPQTKPFGRTVVVDTFYLDFGPNATDNPDAKIDSLPYGAEADRVVVESILEFSRVLLEKCGHRSLFNSSERLNVLLNTTSLSLLQSTLRLGVSLAQRYHANASKQHRPPSNHPHAALLANHYNIELDRVQALAQSFPRPPLSGKNPELSPSIKGKEKAEHEVQPSVGKCNANDFVCLTRGSSDEKTVSHGSKSYDSAPDNWRDWGNVRISYYSRADGAGDGAIGGYGSQMPMTPTPTQKGGKAGRVSSGEDPSQSTGQSPTMKHDESARGMKVLEISPADLGTKSLEQHLKDNLEELPQNLRYDLLNRLRVAHALSSSEETRRQILAIRILAITNLAYIYPDVMFQQKILLSDSDEPKRLQLAYQLAEYVHLGVAGDIDASTTNQTFAFSCLDGLARHKSRTADVCAALNVNVNHGILMFIVRKAVAGLTEDNQDDDFWKQVEGDEGEDWREALFSLLRTLLNSGDRRPETLVSAGLVPMLVEILNLRTDKARGIYPRVMEFLDIFVHSTRDALATLATAKGFDAISDLIASEAQTAFNLSAEGKGIPQSCRTPTTDYQIAYPRQQALRWLFRVVNHVMQHNRGGFERVLRNLIDSPPLLTSLKLILENAKVFGSVVWSGAVNIVSHFIHNEPTSYAVIAEAGLSKSFLESVMGRPIDPQNDPNSIRLALPFIPSKGVSEGVGLMSRLLKTPECKGSDGILPSSDAILCIPMAFGAICLNSTGLELFQSTDALERFFDIFESPEHVKCMAEDQHLLRVLGNSFDELIRHHPPLKEAVMSCVIRLVARVGLLAKSKAWESGLGTKLWTEGDDGQASLVGGPASAIADVGAEFTENIEDCQSTVIPGAESIESDHGMRTTTRYSDVFGVPNVDNWKSMDRDNNGLTVSDYLFPVIGFLSALFDNQSICSYFVECGGAEYVLDYTTLQSVPFDFRVAGKKGVPLPQVIHLMAESKPHLVVPSLLHRAEDVIDKLEPFWSQFGEKGFFTPLTSTSDTPTTDSAEIKRKGTYFAKHLVAVNILTESLREVYNPPLYTSRSAQQMNPFTQTNLADKYVKILKRLGLLHAACVWEEILLQKELPDAWKDAMGGTSSALTQEIQPVSNAIRYIVGSDDSTPAPSRSGDNGSAVDQDNAAVQSHASVENEPARRNVKTLRFLLGALPTAITGLLHMLGRGLVTKRRDIHQRQNAVNIADAIAASVLEQLDLRAPKEASSKDRLSYLIIALSSFSRLLFQTTGEGPQSYCLTMVLHAFKKRNGLQVLKDLAGLFLRDIREIGPDAPNMSPSTPSSTQIASAYGGIKLILTFFAETSSSDYVLESNQTQAMSSNDRNRDRPDALLPSQFLVELRMAALSMVQEMWGTSFVDHASDSIVKSLIEILRLAFEGRGEAGAYHRGNVPPPVSPATPKPFSFHRDLLSTLIEKGFDETLSKEALYRCNNIMGAAEEYCAAQKSVRAPPRNPIQFDELESAPPRVGSPQQAELPFTNFEGPSGEASAGPTGGQPLEDPIASLLGQIQGAQGEGGAEASGSRQQGSNASGGTGRTGSGHEGLRIQDLLNSEEAPTERRRSEQASSSQAPPSQERDVITVEDLDSERDKIRSNLIERCLDVLNCHHGLTFELADLIGSATIQHHDQASFRREVGETLMHFLISLQMDENFETGGKKIAGYANLLGLILQDKDIYNSTLDELKENFSLLLGFIKLPPSSADKPTDEACPWIGQVLLIMERILSDDAQPVQIQWSPPDPNDDDKSDVPAKLEEPAISSDDKTKLFEAVVNILPRVGRSESLALSVSRILVILTRQRSIALQLGEKRNLQRLFIMVKQLSNASDTRLQGSLMLILRHIIEDDETVRQVMRSEIAAAFEQRSRPIDTTGYVRQFHHLVLRSPQLFVDVTNEKLKIQTYDPHQRPQQLVLKQEKKTQNGEQREDGNEGGDDGGGQASENATNSVSKEESKESKEKVKGTELKPPVVEHPDDVIHYLLSELLSYRDVDDKVPPTPSALGKEAGKSEDVEMTSGDRPATAPSSGTRDAATKKAEKRQFKAEEHPIYIYRCFLLQCLAELLASYNRTKVEFINFSRRADAQVTTTPSKPRSGVINYLLHVVIPTGTLEHDDSIPFKKRSHTSSWAMRVIVALCSRTGEFGGISRRRNQTDEEDEPDLMFVRKFVLEHALRSYKEANASNEPLDSKYARLMCLADLFDKMLSGSSASEGTAQFPSSSRQIAKTMFEKNFIAAFTSSVADVDLNFPGSKRAVKYILRPLNKLTQTAVVLSETSSLPSPSGETGEDEISSATSVSDIDEDREETPDLFRHSTLGMFEPDHEDITSSEESEEDDDEMYDEYDDEMYDDEEIGDHDGVDDVSDDEERGPMEGLPGDDGMDVEVLLEGGMSDENEDDEDEDEDEDPDEIGVHHSDEEDEVMAGEITADRQNDSLHGGDDDEGEWDTEDYSEEGDHALDHLEDEMGDLAQRDHGERFEHQPHFDSLLRVLEQAGGAVERIESDMGMEGNAHDGMEEDEDDIHEDEEDEEVDELEEEVDDLEDDQDEDADLHSPWGADEPIPGHGHVHVRRRPPPPFSIFPGGFPGRHGMLPVPSYRTHHTRIPSPRNDDGVNPLLRRPDPAAERQAEGRRPGAEAFSDWVQAIDTSASPGRRGPERTIPVDSPVTFVNAIMQVIGQGGPGLGLVSRPDGFHVHLDRGSLPQRVQDLLGGGGRPQPGSQQPRSRDDPIQAVTFSLTTTTGRWQEEARILFGNTHIENAQRIVNALLKVLVPPAIEEEKERQKQADEELKRLEDERIERERREKLEREEAEREQKRKEEEEEARRQQEEAERAAAAARQPAEPEPMEDVQPTTSAQGAAEPSGEGEAAQAAQSEPRPQVHTTIRGRQIDITGMDIDPEYLEALPEEIREEVIMQQLAEQRSHAAAAGEEPSEINPEFLEALPSDIREELLQQEAADRRRRERETSRRDPAANGAPQAEDMDPASFIATLEPSLRQTVLADQPEDVLASLGPEFVSEARAVPGRRLYQHDADVPMRRREQPLPGGEGTKKRQRRPVVQLLDKAGIATLLRLMFMTMHSNVRHNLNDILHNVCQNRQNRMEVISLLLLILQDGSADISAVERGFAHLSLRAKTPTSQKTPQSIKRSLPLPGPEADNDVTPLMVIQQCLSGLSFLTQYNPHIAWFFLTEHETPAALKLKAARKGKSKENRAIKYPLNSLLSLLDRKVILDSPSCMEQLSALLGSVTQPLTVLLRKEKGKEDGEAKPKSEERREAETQPAEAQSEAARDDTTMTDAETAETGQREGRPTGNEQTESSGAPAEEQKQKKQRTLEPPVVPELNLQLVVRVLAARECNAKTSREIVSAINNLSAVPGAREVFGKELISQAKTLSQTIFKDLDDLLPHVEQAQSGTDLQGMALSKFTPSGSDQAKLLRVLTALDYLFDPHRVDRNKSEAENWEKADVLKSLYESATFGPLWSKLSDCLAIIRQKENMLNVATILLPVIESLMVVCKNTSLKDIPLPRHRQETTVSSPSPEPESGMEGLFFQFTEDHRKVLNELVRQNPRLMSGSFALLVKNPTVLEFDNKRNYFNRRIHSRGTDARRPHPPLQLSVRRDQVFLDSFKSLYFKSAEEMKYGKLSVRFHGEEGVDAGGVTREWFQVLARGMFNPNYALFIPVASDCTTFHPNRLSGVNQEHLTFFKFIGRIIGKALYEGRVLDCHFSRAVYKRILGRSVSIKDMETLDLDYYKSLLWMLENDITDIITENFAVEVEDFGETQVIDLVENGRNIPVTQENKEEYVQRVVEYRLTGSVQEQLDKFLEGFHDIIPADLISIFNEQELELLISGLPEIDVGDWKNHTEYHNYSASSPQIQWFWRAVRSFEKEERAKLLQFVTGTSKVPLNGFRELEGMNGFNMFNIHKDYSAKDRLPTTHTCFNQLDLPEYDNYETLRKRLYTAMTAGSEYFGFA